jgi:hypothetical protein
MVENRKKRLRFRIPHGKELRHKIGFEAAKNYDYDCVGLQRETDLCEVKNEFNATRKKEREWPQNSVYHIPSKKEFEIVTKFKIASRFSYFVDTVINYREMWLCYDGDGDLFYSYDDQSRKGVWVWPAKIYAELFLEHENITYLTPVKLHKFLEEYISKLAESSVNIFIFPLNNEGAVMAAESFRNMMETEWNNVVLVDSKPKFLNYIHKYAHLRDINLHKGVKK